MLTPITDVLDDLRAGKPIILVDDENRENEGDIVVAAEKITPAGVNFMAKEARGLICLSLTNELADKVDLPPMATRNEAPLGTAFTVSIEAREGVTTGISAADRARTILTAIADDAKPRDLVRPGHVFPLRARDGGVLVRNGQTEGSVDLCRLAGLKPAAVICEIMNDDGTMARMPDLEKFAARHGIKICSVADLVRYRLQHERIIKRVSAARMPTFAGYFDIYLYHSLADGKEHVALCHNVLPSDLRPADVTYDQPVLVRVHSECLTGDVFGSQRCDCGNQLHAAMQAVQAAGQGVIVYLRQEGRGIGLAEKIKAYALQDEGYDTVEANERLGHKADKREYGTGCQILMDLGVRKLKLLTNNPSKRSAISAYGMEIVERVPLEMPPNEENNYYMATKRDKLGHILQLPKDSGRHKKTRKDRGIE
ncbi:MAG: bifunctional 3,4-dihydroxy-2-butanone-4-phosphate synthase/GTP cyclohydrolase II [Planctomycetes bacterium]|nr:bifunctional 3,4-dihydroxy-2-butanone-4-phosphate synthase/GTP cyclohydrolase II [Planctomycetota bacterium]MCW8134370.1 bifunctional 3,4-dihydroxy-2-butanone-4-phosphate synthase/GTP cyclohydrolase II [Planctomycetota bacterium]